MKNIFILKKELSDRGISPADLCRLTKISKSTISSIIKGGTESPHPRTIETIKAALQKYDSEHGKDVKDQDGERFFNQFKFQLKKWKNDWSSMNDAQKSNVTSGIQELLGKSEMKKFVEWVSEIDTVKKKDDPKGNNSGVAGHEVAKAG